MILGLTGGIASGKSTASDYFRSLGYSVIDADKIARGVVLPGAPALKKLEKTFGRAIIQADGQLDRLALAGILFSSDKDRQTINAIMQPYIRKAIKKEIKRYTANSDALLVVDIPLLFEEKYEGLVDQVMVIAVNEDTQLERLMHRDQITLANAKQRILSQMPIDEKKKRADIIIDNEGSREDMYDQIDDWLQNK